MSGKLRAKFSVISVTRTVGSEQLEMIAVYGKDGSDNAQWSKATPVGKLTMTITNEQAWGTLKPGDEIYLDISVLTPQTA